MPVLRLSLEEEDSWEDLDSLRATAVESADQEAEGKRAKIREKMLQSTGLIITPTQ